MSYLTKEQQIQIITLKAQNMSSRKIAKQVLGRESAKSTVNDFLSRVNGVEEFAEKIKEKVNPVVKILDVETAPEIVYTFRRFKAFISPEQVISRGYLLSYSEADLYTAEVKGANLTHYPLFDIDYTDDWELCQTLWKVLDEADVVIAHNGVKFDKAYINQRFAYHDMMPPSHYVVVDTLKAAKKQFALPSNALKELCLYFETENFKLDNAGFELWKRCREGDRSAFQEMQTYNDGDVVSLRDVYLKILPYIPQHPNMSAYYKDEKVRCSRCGSEHVHVIEGKQFNTAISSFNIVRCDSCGGLSRDRANIRSKGKMRNTVIGI